MAPTKLSITGLDSTKGSTASFVKYLQHKYVANTKTPTQTITLTFVCFKNIFFEVKPNPKQELSHISSLGLSEKGTAIHIPIAHIILFKNSVL